MHDSSTCPFCKGAAIHGSLSDDQFSAFLASCRDELAVKQELFRRRIQGAPRWHYDMADLSLNIGQFRFGMTPIGTYSTPHASWLWAWANDDFPTIARAASARIQALHDITGFKVFVVEGIGASAADAVDLAALAVHSLGAIGLYRCPDSEEPELFLAVHEAPPEMTAVHDQTLPWEN